MLQHSTEGKLVAEIDMKPVGWASFGIARDKDVENAGEIYAVYVDPEHWKKGIGKLLITHLENWVFSE